MPHMVKESRLNRPLYAIPEGVWLGLFDVLAQIHKQLNPSQEYSVDSSPCRCVTTTAFGAAGCTRVPPSGAI